jgi:hypothetical protein
MVKRESAEDADEVEDVDEVESRDEDRLLLDEAARFHHLLRSARSGSVEGDRDQLGPTAGSSSTVTSRTLWSTENLLVTEDSLG